jgi:hypothetical protein
VSVSARAIDPSLAEFEGTDTDVFEISGPRASARGDPEIARTPASTREPIATSHPLHFDALIFFMAFLLLADG